MTSRNDNARRTLQTFCGCRKREQRHLHCCDFIPLITSQQRTSQLPSRHQYYPDMGTMFQIASVVILLLATATASSSNCQFHMQENQICSTGSDYPSYDTKTQVRRLVGFSYYDSIKKRRCKNQRSLLQKGHDRFNILSPIGPHSFIPSTLFRQRYGQQRTPSYLMDGSVSILNDSGEDDKQGDAIEQSEMFNVASSAPLYDGPTTSLITELDYPAPTKQITNQLEVLQTIILQQQRQIDALLKLLQQQPSLSTPLSVVNGDQERIDNNYKTTPPLFQPLKSAVGEKSKLVSTISNQPNAQKLKAMLFIDGTWLYYGINERLARDAATTQKYGRGWQHRYDIDWAKLPKLLCTILQNDIQTFYYGNIKNKNAAPCVEIDLVRSMVYTSYKADTSTTSYRYKLFQDLKKADFSVQMMETVGKSEKCVDIQLAVEILHYATLENRTNSYDIALLLTGDKDLMPAIIRTRCKGKQVGLVSMRPGCNRALVDTPGLLDFDVIWLEDLLDQLLIPRVLDNTIDDADMNANESNSGVSMYALHKVVYDFIKYSQLKQVSSRDLGKYLKQLSINDVGGGTLLETMKKYYGGMYQYLSSMGNYDCELPPFVAGNYSYWISIRKQSDIDSDDSDGFDNIEVDVDDRDDDEIFFLDKSSVAHLTENEKEFFSKYSVERLIQDRETIYSYSLEGPSEPGVIVPSEPNGASRRAKMDKESLSLDSTQKVVNDFLIHSGCERVILSDLENYLQHLRVTRSCSLLDEINRLYGSTLIFLKSFRDCYVIEPGKSAGTFWIQPGDEFKNPNDSDTTQVSDTEQKFFMRYNIEPLIISRQRWYSDTFSAIIEDMGYQNNSTSSSPNFKAMTVVELKNACRDMGLALSGTKSVLMERIQNHLESKKVNGTNKRVQSPNQMMLQGTAVNMESSTFKYLRDLIEEYVHAKGGVAHSRIIGRYLAANKATSRGKANALQELKALYGSLINFLNKNSDTFVLFKDRSSIGIDGNDDPTTDNFGFSVRLKRTVV